MDSISYLEALLRIAEVYQVGIDRGVFPNIRNNGQSLSILSRDPYKEYTVDLDYFRNIRSSIKHLDDHNPEGSRYLWSGTASLLTNPELCVWDIGHFIETINFILSDNVRPDQPSFKHINTDIACKPPLRNLTVPFINSSGRTIQLKILKPLLYTDYLSSSPLGPFEQLKSSLAYSASRTQSGQLQCFDFGAGRSHKIHFVLAEIADIISSYVPIDILPSILLRGYFERNQRSTYRILSVYGDMEKIDTTALRSLKSPDVQSVTVSTTGMFPFLNSDSFAKIIGQLMDIGCTSGFHIEADAYTHLPGTLLGTQMLSIGLGEIPVDGYFQNLDICYFTDFGSGSYGSGSKSASESESVARSRVSALLSGLETLHNEREDFVYSLSIPLQPLTGIPLTFYQWSLQKNLAV